MKLYTEEQLKEAFFQGINYAKSITPASMGFIEQYVQNTIDSLTPIELPSDEEIEKLGGSGMHPAYNGGVKEGAKWVIEQIKQQDK